MTPESSSTSSASFDVNIDYWLSDEASTVPHPTSSSSSSHPQQQPHSATDGGQQNPKEGKALNVRGAYKHLVVARSVGHGANNQQSNLTVMLSARDKKIKRKSKFVMVHFF